MRHRRPVNMVNAKPTTDHRVATTVELTVRDPAARRIVVRGTLADAPSIRLAPGQILCGEDDHCSIAFADGVDGVQLTTDNEVSALQLTVSPDKRAILNDTRVDPGPTRRT